MTRNVWIPLIILSILLLTTPVGQAEPIGGVLYAKPNATGTGDCGSWANACSLQTALDQAIEGDEIWVAQGTHKPTTGTSRHDSFQLPSGVAVYGGFDGSETAREQRDWEAHKTILSGDIGITGDNSDNSYSVVRASGSLSSEVLDGFTVSDGNGNGSYGAGHGGGLYSSDSLILRNMVFSGNSAIHGGGLYSSYVGGTLTMINVEFNGNSASQGGGMYNTSSLLSLSDARFSRNSAVDGGGLYNIDSSPALTDVFFTFNSANKGGGVYSANSSPMMINIRSYGNSADSGGAVFNHDSSPTISGGYSLSNSARISGGGIFNFENSDPVVRDTTISSNSARSGGGMYNSGNSNPGLTNVTFRSNSAEDGGGMYNVGCSPDLKDSSFEENSASGGGGGMYNTSSSPKLDGLDFSKNAADNGGGMYNSSSSPTLVDVTLSENTAATRGGGLYNYDGGTPKLTNCTLSANSAHDGGGGMYNNTSDPHLMQVDFVGNYVKGTGGRGGGMYNYGAQPTVTNSAYLGNRSWYSDGGALYNAHSRGDLTNVVISGNTAGGNGGGVYNDHSWLVLTNATFSANSASNSAGGIYIADTDRRPSLYNCILWDNTPEEIVGGWPNIEYSTVRGGYAGTGNIGSDPLFMDADGPDGAPGTPDDNLRLLNGSPSIDAGKKSYNTTSFDLAGNTRITDGDGDGSAVIDMGAYEAPAGKTYSLTVERLGTGNGTVSSDPPGIHCGSTCTTVVGENRSISLTATAEPDSSFVGWGGACAGTSTTCTLEMTSAKYVTAAFELAHSSRLIVDNVTSPSGATQLFQFRLQGGPDSISRSFALTDAAAPYDGGDLKPGTYAVTETVPEGWTLAGAICDDGSGPGSVDLEPNETVTCTFLNDQSGLCVPPGVSMLLLPADGSSTTEQKPLFKWSALAGALDYRMRLVEAASGVQVFSKKTSQIQFTPDTPLQPMAYFWRVRAYNDCGDGDWSERSALTILPATLDYQAYLALVTKGVRQSAESLQ